MQGKSPDELWSEEFKVKRVISKDALKLFCMITSKDIKIGRNGVYDAQFRVSYWGEWMICEKGRKVFIRRDAKAFQEAWVFDSKTEEYLGKANMFHEVSYLAKTNIEKDIYKKALALKNKEKKMMKNYIRFDSIPTNQSIVENLVASLEKTEFENKVKVSKIANTSMDKVVQKVKKEENRKISTLKISYETPVHPKRRLFLTEAEKRRWEEQQKRLVENKNLCSKAI